MTETTSINRMLRRLAVLASLIVLISELQFHYRPEEYAQKELLTPVLLLGHLGLSVVVLFVRMRFSVLALLTAIALSPPVASLWKWTQMGAAGHYMIITYLALWALFLLTRWRQTPVAFSFLKEELRYYLID